MDVSPESLRVLVVESNTSARQAIVQLLKECSYQVSCWCFGWRLEPRSAPDGVGGSRDLCPLLDRSWTSRGPRRLCSC